MQSSSSPVAAAAAVVSSSKFKQWKKNNPEKYKQHIQKSNASLREKRKSNPERYQEENKRRAQQRSNKKNEERIRAAEAKRAAAPATTNHVTATATLAYSSLSPNHLFATPTVADHHAAMPPSYPPNAATTVAPVAYISKYHRWKQNNPEKHKELMKKKAAYYREKRLSNPERYKEENKQRRNKKIAERIREAEAKRAEAAAKNEAATTNHVMATTTPMNHQQWLQLQPQQQNPREQLFYDCGRRSENADIIPKCNCNYNFDRSAQLEEQANPIELHGEEEENTTDAFRQTPPLLTT